MSVKSEGFCFDGNEWEERKREDLYGKVWVVRKRGEKDGGRCREILGAVFGFVNLSF